MIDSLQIGIDSASKGIMISGIVAQYKDEDLIFHIADLDFRFSFKSDSGKARLESEILDKEGEMELTFYNCDNNLGICMA